MGNRFRCQLRAACDGRSQLTKRPRRAESFFSTRSRVARRFLATDATEGTDGGSLAASLFGAGGEAGAGHALAQAALFQKILFQPFELLVEQVVGLVDQADENVGHHLRRAGFNELTKVL